MPSPHAWFSSPVMAMLFALASALEASMDGAEGFCEFGPYYSIILRGSSLGIGQRASYTITVPRIHIARKVRCLGPKECSMDQGAKEALREFFSTVRKLNRLGIVRSKNYVDDIGRHLCRVVYGMEPAGWKAGYDGTIGESWIRVRFNNCPVGTPVRPGDPTGYDELIVILGPNCFLRPDDIGADLVFYRFTAEEVEEKFKAASGGYSGGRSVFAQGHDKVLILT